MNILGISCHYHDASACVFQDGQVAAAAQEERFNRRKHCPDFPIQAINYCLQAANATSLDVDTIAFYEKPYLKLQRVLLDHVRNWPFSYRNFMANMPDWLAHRLAIPVDMAGKLGFNGKFLFIPHHLSHASSAFLVSPFDEAAILTLDGIGEWAAAAWGTGRGSRIEIAREMRYPNSLGLLYSAVTAYLGFEVNSGEGKVMALSDFGEPTPEILDRFRRIVKAREDGSFYLDESYFGFIRGKTMHGRKFSGLFGPPRIPGDEISQRHKDIAAGLQRITEDIIVAAARHVQSQTGMKRLCLAGGVALNCVANSRLLRDTPFEELFIQPAAGDAGAALGAAAYVAHSIKGEPRSEAMVTARLGPEFGENRIRRCLANCGVEFRKLEKNELVKYAAGQIAAGRVVGWFQGRMEFGPRALGGRSILADARAAGMKDYLNSTVKHREPFRPYGVCIMAEETANYFDFKASSPFMLLVAQARPEVREKIPSALHVDGSSRLQTITGESDPLLYSLLAEFRDRTGIPMFINTSFNDHGEPIVCTPDDAYACFTKTALDTLVLGDYVVEKPGRPQVSP